MNPQVDEVKQTATKFLAAMLSNPHIYPQVSDQGSRGAMEQKLIVVAVEMAESLIQHVERTHQNKPDLELSQESALDAYREAL